MDLERRSMRTNTWQQIIILLEFLRGRMTTTTHFLSCEIVQESILKMQGKIIKEAIDKLTSKMCKVLST